jgi:hypothetical protein
VFILKKIFFRTSRPISIILGINHPRAKGIFFKYCSNKGPGPLQRGDNNNANMGWVHLKIFILNKSPEPAGQFQSNLIQIILG